LQIGATSLPSAPSISDVFFDPFDKDKVGIRWSTDLQAQPQIEYGLTTAYGLLTPLGGKFQTTHKVQLDNLEPQTTYHFRIRLRDGKGYLKVSSDYIFTTPNNRVRDLVFPSPGSLYAPPGISAIVPASNGHALVSGVGAPNVTSGLQVSLDLANWISIAVVTADNSGLLQFDDSVFGFFPSRFYRFVEL